jgi:3-hydroxyisobutyrate dehydrogenase
MTRRIAFLGLGAMGSRMAVNLLAAGHNLTVWNRSASAFERVTSLGARRAATPREAAIGADFVVSMVTDDNASRSVWLDPDAGAALGLERGATAIESSTVSPNWVKELAATVRTRSASFLDCPVAGSLAQAEARQLVVMAGGEISDFDAAKPLLEAMAGQAKYIGGVGQGIAMKLAVNALLGVQIAATAEALGYLEKTGLQKAHVLSILSGMTIMSPAAVGAAKLIEARDFAPRFPIKLVAKDFRYAIESGEHVGAALPMTVAAKSLFDRLAVMGFGDENFSAIARLYAGDLTSRSV